MTTVKTSITRADIIEAVDRAFRNRADIERYQAREWSDPNAHREFVALLESGRAYPMGDTEIVARAYGGSDHARRVWGESVCAVALDVASNDFPAGTMPNAQITTMGYSAILWPGRDSQVRS